MCTGFTNLNKACLNDPFSLQHIDAMVDATVNYEMLSFMDTYSVYNRILMYIKRRVHSLQR